MNFLNKFLNKTINNNNKNDIYPIHLKNFPDDDKVPDTVINPLLPYPVVKPVTFIGKQNEINPILPHVKPAANKYINNLPNTTVKSPIKPNTTVKPNTTINTTVKPNTTINTTVKPITIGNPIINTTVKPITIGNPIINPLTTVNPFTTFNNPIINPLKPIINPINKTPIPYGQPTNTFTLPNLLTKPKIIKNIKDVYESSEKNLDIMLSKYNVDLKLYTLLEKRYLLVYYLYNDNILDTEEINKYGIEKVAESLKISNNYIDFLEKLNPTIYTVNNIFEYTENDLNTFLINLNIDYTLYTLNEKRYLTMHNLYEHDLLNTMEINIYGLEKFATSLKNASDYKEFLILLKTEEPKGTY